MNFILEAAPMYLITFSILLIIIIFLFIKGLKDNTEKNIKLIKEISLLAFILGFFRSTIELVWTLDDVSVAKTIPPQVLAVGFKYIMITPIVGMLIFLIARLFTIILTWTKK